MCAMGMIMLLASAREARGQLLSPGKLSKAHSSLEGVRSCTECHELKQRGSSPRLCLQCHALVRSRLERKQGFHATVAERRCGECHKEHLGREFNVLRVDSAKFAHEQTGFTLKGGHTSAGCRSCHAAELVADPAVRTHAGSEFLSRTFLGLSPRCTACHTSDSPHEQQFTGRECTACHTETDWDSAPAFDHAKASFALTGRHAEVSCTGCHTERGPSTAVQWKGIRFASCADCHRDPHAGRMAGSCSSCHNVEGWLRITRDLATSFDHTRTGFTLRGAHRRAECRACHSSSGGRSGIAIRFAAGKSGATYAQPLVKDCASCHRDPHPRAVAQASQASCAGCHSENAWSPTSYSAAKHTRSFALIGSHAVVPCLSCHRNGPTGSSFVLPERSCRSCHQNVDPHRGRYGARGCDQCHNPTDWKVARFNHESAADQACAACHASADPHAGQFGRTNCGACHGTSTFRIASYSHSRTRFPLTGAHEKIACAACHRTERDQEARTFVRYKPLEPTCRACHGSRQ